jgi:hypothetical protein
LRYQPEQYEEDFVKNYKTITLAQREYDTRRWKRGWWLGVRVIVFNATFNNIPVISWHVITLCDKV